MDGDFLMVELEKNFPLYFLPPDDAILCLSVSQCGIALSPENIPWHAFHD